MVSHLKDYLVKMIYLRYYDMYIWIEITIFMWLMILRQIYQCICFHKTIYNLRLSFITFENNENKIDDDIANDIAVASYSSNCGIFWQIIGKPYEMLSCLLKKINFGKSEGKNFFIIKAADWHNSQNDWVTSSATITSVIYMLTYNKHRRVTQTDIYIHMRD